MSDAAASTFSVPVTAAAGPLDIGAEDIGPDDIPDDIGADDIADDIGAEDIADDTGAEDIADDDMGADDMADDDIADDVDAAALEELVVDPAVEVEVDEQADSSTAPTTMALNTTDLVRTACTILRVFTIVPSGFQR